jgi:YARHG domain
VERSDLKERSAEELRLMRNTIYARAGREFKDADLRAYFGKQPWYRPTATPAKLSAVDEKNLARIKEWEPPAKALADLRALAPRWGQDDAAVRRADCEADGTGTLKDRKLESRLVALSKRLPWSTVDNYDDTIWDEVNMKKAKVSLACLPDLDGDGAPEAVVEVDRGYKNPDFKDNNIALVFLVSGRGPDWRAVAPLGVDGTSPGVEGYIGTQAKAVKLASGKLGLAVERDTGAGGDECCQEYETVTVFALKGRKLAKQGSFDVGEPCKCADE